MTRPRDRKTVDEVLTLSTPIQRRTKRQRRKTGLGTRGLVTDFDKIIYRNSLGKNINATVYDLTVTTYSAGVDAIINQTAVDELTVTTYQAGLTVGANIPQNATVELLLTEYQASIYSDLVVDQTSPDALAVTTYQSSFSLGEPGNTWFNSHTWKIPTFGATWWPQGLGDTTITTIVDNLVVTEYQSTVTPNIAYVSANVDTLLLTEYQSTVTVSDIISTNVDALTIVTPQATIFYDVYFNVNAPDALTVTTYQAGVSELVIVDQTSTVPLVVTTYLSAVVYNPVIASSVVSMSITTYRASVLPTIFTIQYNREFTYTDLLTGVSFTKNSGSPVTPTYATKSGNVVSYTIYMEVVPGDSIVFDYVYPTGNYIDFDTSVPMQTHGISVTNCWN